MPLPTMRLVNLFNCGRRDAVRHADHQVLLDVFVAGTGFGINHTTVVGGATERRHVRSDGDNDIAFVDNETA